MAFVSGWSPQTSSMSTSVGTTPADPQQQGGQKHSGTSPAQWDRLAVPSNLERSQDGELHRSVRVTTPVSAVSQEADSVRGDGWWPAAIGR